MEHGNRFPAAEEVNVMVSIVSARTDFFQHKTDEPRPKTKTSSDPGFAGAMAVDTQLFSQVALNGDVAFLGCDLEIDRRYGRPNPGAASLLREKTGAAGAYQGLYDLGSVTSTDPSEAMIEIADTAATVVNSGGLPIIIGCDHTASLAGLLGSARDETERPVYVYFDAHFDLGRNCTEDDRLHNGGFVGEILKRKWARCAVNVGGRSIATQLNYPETPRFASIPAYTSTSLLTQCLAPLKGETIYVSLDADVLDPAFAPNVACPEPGGLSLEALHICCRWLNDNCRVIGADLMETFPHQGDRSVEDALLKCLLTLTGKEPQPETPQRIRTERSIRSPAGPETPPLRKTDVPYCRLVESEAATPCAQTPMKHRAQTTRLTALPS
ncbi:arginase family protein [Thiorhodococcus fuscus]|uniref:Arginase family protein n=1 Tax=Thiorhodococcus fuscus TaxID=527200 RepID=A0ABW4Y2M4_9GAMM